MHETGCWLEILLNATFHFLPITITLRSSWQILAFVVLSLQELWLRHSSHKNESFCFTHLNFGVSGKVLENIQQNFIENARLLAPPSRSSMWRMGYPNPVDYQDNEGFCGGFGVQWGVNKGECGICGDRYDARVREHEAPGGRYASIVDYGVVMITMKVC